MGRQSSGLHTVSKCHSNKPTRHLAVQFLTSGSLPCSQEGNTTSDNIRAYFDLYEGGFGDEKPIIKTATWDAWLQDEDNFADQVLRVMERLNLSAHTRPGFCFYQF